MNQKKKKKKICINHPLIDAIQIINLILSGSCGMQFSQPSVRGDVIVRNSMEQKAIIIVEHELCTKSDRITNKTEYLLNKQQIKCKTMSLHIKLFLSSFLNNDVLIRSRNVSTNANKKKNAHIFHLAYQKNIMALHLCCK